MSFIKGINIDILENFRRIMLWKLIFGSYSFKNYEMGDFRIGVFVCVFKDKLLLLFCGEGCNDWLFCIEFKRFVS